MERPGKAGAPLYGASSYGCNPSRFDAALAKSPFVYHKKRVKLTVLLLCVVIPVVLYAAVCAALSFPVHRASPALAWLVVLIGGAAVLAVGALAATATRNKYWQGDATREPYWYLFLAFTMLVAYCFALFLGFTNWWNNTLPYLDLQNLSAHPAVDTATMTGRQLMDVGRVTFTKGTKLDIRRAIGFKNVDRYCVAPITPSTGELESYDFWAVGLNCCSGAANDFHCGEYSNPNARGGLRLMRADQRAFYRLAVQQAEAMYNIKARHPLFFYWMQDPLAELETYRNDAEKYFLLGLGATICCQILVLVLAVLGYTKL